MFSNDRHLADLDEKIARLFSERTSRTWKWACEAVWAVAEPKGDLAARILVDNIDDPGWLIHVTSDSDTYIVELSDDGEEAAVYSYLGKRSRNTVSAQG